MFRLLLVDDEPIMKIAFRKLINGNKKGFKLVGTASNGLEALQFVDKQPIDIIVTDLKMPHMNGIKLIKALKNNKFDGSILVLSSYSDFDLVREALLAGAQDYILKGNLTADILLNQLEKASENIDKIRKEVTQYDRIREQNESLMRINILKEYFLSSQPLDIPLPQKIINDFDNSRNEFWLFNILLWQNNSVKTKRKIPITGIVDILMSIFAEANPDCLSIHNNEFLCIVPAAPFLAKDIHPEDKAKQIERQIQRYFDLQTTIILPQAIKNIHTAHEKYRLCRSVQNICFYKSKHIFLYPEIISFSDIPADWNSMQTALHIQKLFSTLGTNGVADYLEDILTQCEDIPVNPMSVRGFFYRVMQKIHSAAFEMSNDEAVMSAGTKVLESTSEEALKQMLMELLPELLTRTLPPDYSKYKKEVKQALLYVRFHYTEKITLNDVAKAVNLNPSYLCRLFKKETNKSLFEYITALRMEKAAKMIVQGNKYIKEIAASVGLEDQFYFTRIFKKYHGVAPSEYCSTE